jgi:hypothetical protein
VFVSPQVQDLSRALQSERSVAANFAAERDCLARENQELRDQLEAAKKAVMLAQRQSSSTLRIPNLPLSTLAAQEGAGPSGSPAAGLRGLSSLQSSPRQQEHFAAEGTGFTYGGADGELLDESSGCNMGRDQPEVPVAMSPLQQHMWSGVSSQDMTPTRDQYGMDPSPSMVRFLHY